MLLTLIGIVISVRPVQTWNASSPMFVTLSGIVILVRPVQSAKAYIPMFVTVEGIVNEPDAVIVTHIKALLSFVYSADPSPKNESLSDETVMLGRFMQ